MSRLRYGFCLLFLFAITGCSLSSLGIGEGEEVAVISGAPVVELSAPLANSTFLQGVVVNILASVSNAGQDIQRVEFRINEMTIADVASPNPAGAPRFSVTRTWTAEAAGNYTVSVIAYRGDGTSSQPATVQINVVDGLAEPTETEEPAPTQTTPPPTATNTQAAPPTTNAPAAEVDNTSTEEADADAGTGGEAAAATEEAAASSDEVVVRVVRGGMNVRRGPSTNFVPPVGVLVGETDVPIIAANQDGSWYKIKFQGADAWISSAANLVTLVSGDPSTLPIEQGPPIPTLAPPTAIPATAAPLATTAPGTTPGATVAAPTGGDGPNLVVTGFELRQGSRPVNTIFINEPAVAFIKVKNVGNQPATGFFAVLRIVNKDDGGFLLERATAVNSLAVNEEIIVQVPFTDEAGPGLVKSAAAFVDLNNQVPESNEQDNGSTFAIEYVLGVP
jgi:hypothetical protein